MIEKDSGRVPFKETPAYQYDNNLRQSLDAIRQEEPTQLPSRLTDLVLKTPTTNEDWKEKGWQGEKVTSSVGQNVYRDVVITAFDAAARDPKTAKDFLAELDKNPDETKQRLHPVDTIDDPVYYPVGRTSPSALLGEIGRSPSKIPEVPLLKTITNHLRNIPDTDRQAVEAIVTWCEPKLPKTKSERAAEESAAHNAQVRETYPEFLIEHGVGDHSSITDLSDAEIKTMAPLSREYLLATPLSSTSERAIAQAVVERGDALRETATDALTHASSFENFFEQLPEFYKDFPDAPKTNEAFYANWQHTYITERRMEQAKETLEEAGIPTDSERFLPEGCIDIKVQGCRPNISYGADELDTVIKDLQRYLTPKEITDASSFFENEKSQKLANQIREWAAQPEPDGDFDHNIDEYPPEGFSLKKDAQGYHLQTPNSIAYPFGLENFATFSGKEKDLTFESMEVSYTAAPPSDRTPQEETEERSYVEVSVPIDAIATHLGDQFGLTEEEREKLVQNTLEDLRGEDESYLKQVADRDDVKVKSVSISTVATPEQVSYKDGVISYPTRVYPYREPGSESAISTFNLPQVRLSITGAEHPLSDTYRALRAMDIQNAKTRSEKAKTGLNFSDSRWKAPVDVSKKD